MNTVGRAKFAVKPLVAAVALAVSAGSAYALAPNALPGGGVIDKVSTGTNIIGTGYTVSGGGVAGETIVNATTNTALIRLNSAGTGARAVINWGGAAGAALEVQNSVGFNVGSNATLAFTATKSGGAVLNIDTSGLLSQVDGVFRSTDFFGVFNNVAIFLANANGIVVGPTGQIASPLGVGLLGAGMDKTATADFVKDNFVGLSYLDLSGKQAPVTVNGSIFGEFVANDPAPFVILAGNNVTNTGDIAANHVDVWAGMQPVAAAAVVSGSLAATHRLWRVGDSPLLWDEQFLCAPGCNIEIAPSGSGARFINEGAITAATDGLTKGFGWIHAETAAGTRSGIDGNLDQTIGLFADEGVYFNSWADAKTEIYNVVTGWHTNKTLPNFWINAPFYLGSGASDDVTIRALTPGTQASSILTPQCPGGLCTRVFDVVIYGDNVLIDSTINHTTTTPGGGAFTGFGDPNIGLDIHGITSVTINKDVGSADNVRIRSDGSLVIAGNVIGDTEKLGVGGINISAHGAVISGNLTTYADNNDFPDDSVGIFIGTGGLILSGDVSAIGNVPTYVGNAVTIFSAGPTVISGDVIAHNDVDITGDLVVSGDITSQTADIHITNPDTSAGANTLISGKLLAGDDINIHTFGTLAITNTVTAVDFVEIINKGSGATNTTTISGDVTSLTGDIFIANTPLVTGNLNISGALSAEDEYGDVTVVSAGNLQLGKVTAGDDIDIELGGLTSKLSGPMTAGDVFNYAAPFATTKLLPAAVITAPEVNLGGSGYNEFFNGLLNFVGVNASGNTYLLGSQKPDFQINTNDLDIHIQGTINAPIAGNTFWLTNPMVVMPLDPLSPVFTRIWADGGSFQAINLKFTGNAVVDSWHTTTPFRDVGLSTGTEGGGALSPNGGSSMILNATGALFIAPGDTGAFQFPGSLSFNGGTLVDISTPVYNAFTTHAVPFQGVWVYVGAGGIINSTSYYATNGDAWVNFNKQPSTASSTSGPTVYRIYGVGTPVPLLFGFVDDTLAALHQNSYPFAITGSPVNTTPIGPTNPWAPPVVFPTPI